MGKYTSLESCIFGVFGGAGWQAEGINTYPSDFFPDNPGSEYLKVCIIAAGKSVNLKSVSGVLIIDIELIS